MTTSDVDLLSQYTRSRDAEAFAQIVERYQRLVFATCRRVLRDPNNLDDATQETFLRLAKNVEAKRINLGAWLHCCARNVAIDFNRRQATRFRHEFTAAHSVQTMDHSQQELAELREHLDTALEKLNEEDRELIMQRFFKGRTQTELAANASVSPAMLSYRMERAIGKLRKKLEVSGWAALAGERWIELLEAEHATSKVPAQLTANLMKIGLGIVPSAAGTWFAVKIFFLLAIMMTVVIGGMAIRRHETASVSLPMITTESGKDALKWQTTQPTVPAVLAGRVLDNANHGIAGAIVRLNSYRNGITSSDSGYRTDASGNYVVRSIDADTYRMSVFADGFASIGWDQAGPEFELTPTSQARRDIVMQRGLRIAVVVTDALGAPIAGARIGVFGAPNHRGTPDAIDGMYSDETGAAKMTVPLADAGYTVAVQSRGYAPAHAQIAAKFANAPVQLNFFLLPGQIVKCVAICSDGKPAAGWSIDAVPEWWMGSFDIDPAKIDSSGNFTLHDIGPGRYRLMVHSIMQVSVTVALPPSQQPLHIDLPMPSPGATPNLMETIHFTGERRSTEIFASVQRIPDGWVQYSTRIPPPRPGQESMTHTIDFGQVLPGKYELTFSGREIEPVFGGSFTVPGPLPPVKLNIIGPARLTGTVTDASTGTPITHFAVRPRLVETYFGRRLQMPDQPWTQVSNAQGSFCLDLDGPGVYVVNVSADRHAAITSELIRIQPGAMTGTVNIKLPGDIAKQR
jgi:RNA polymerase sigma factor (sigma-70 family)